MAEKTTPAVGDVVGGKYVIEGLLGEGGMGSVFAALHQLTGKRVALKWMLPELADNAGAVQRFLREAQAAGRIDHPNVVDVYDVGQDQGSWFLVMELLHGEPLGSVLERGAQSAEQVVQLLLPAMRGVAAAHRRGVIHRDLKPDNIFLCRDPEGRYRAPKVLDFGISKLSPTDGKVNPRLTKTGAVLGTPYYMSPEQIRGSSHVDHRVDVYAFGVILYQALTGQVPFQAESYSALILEIATATPPRLRELNPGVPPELEQVVLRAMARDVEARFSDIESLARALEPFADGVRFRSIRPDPTRGPARLPSGSDTPTPFTSDSEIHVHIPVARWRPLLLSAGLFAGLGALAAGLLWAGGKAGGPTQAEPSPAVGAGAPEPAAAVAAQAARPAALDAAVAEDGPEPVEPAGAAGSRPKAATGAAGAAQARDVEARRPRTKRDTARRRARERRSTRRARRSDPALAEPAQGTPAPAPKRGRTGTLAVDEF